jgi:hypothetical protein
MIYIIIKKSTGFASTEDFASVTEDIDSATFECAKMNMQSTDPDVYYYIQSSSDEGGFIGCETEGEEIYLTDGDHDIYLDYERKVCYHEDRNHEEGPVSESTYIEVVNIKMLGTHIDDLAISDELRKKINEEAKELGEYLTKNEGE